MKIHFVRECSGYHMEEYYQSHIEYRIFATSTDIQLLANTVLSSKDTILLLDCTENYTSPASVIICSDVKANRLIVTERPVKYNGIYRMEIVFSGNLNAFRRFFKMVSKWIDASDYRSGCIDCKFDGIGDNYIAPFSVGVTFAHNRDELIVRAKAGSEHFFPDELRYMTLEEASPEDRYRELEDFKVGMLHRISRAYR